MEGDYNPATASAEADLRCRGIKPLSMMISYIRVRGKPVSRAKLNNLRFTSTITPGSWLAVWSFRVIL